MKIMMMMMKKMMWWCDGCGDGDDANDEHDDDNNENNNDENDDDDDIDGVDEHDEDTDENEGKKTKKRWVRQVASTGSPPVFWWCDSLSSITGLSEMTHGISSVRSWNYIFLSLYALSQLKFHRLKIYSIQQAQHQKKQYNRLQ